VLGQFEDLRPFDDVRDCISDDLAALFDGQTVKPCARLDPFGKVVVAKQTIGITVVPSGLVLRVMNLRSRPLNLRAALGAGGVASAAGAASGADPKHGSRRSTSLIEPVFTNSNRVSGGAFWKLQFRDQRLARKMPLRSPDHEKLGLQRLAASPLNGGNYATIFSAGTWPPETGLAGWACRTRTRKRRYRIVQQPEALLGKLLSLVSENIGGQF
jgi:hypothetical protein